MAFFEFYPPLKQAVNVGFHLFASMDATSGEWAWDPEKSDAAKVAALAMFGLMGVVLLAIRSRKDKAEENETHG